LFPPDGLTGPAAVGGVGTGAGVGGVGAGVGNSVRTTASSLNLSLRKVL